MPKEQKEITISRALSEIKLLDKKITDRIQKSAFAATVVPGTKLSGTFSPASDLQAVEDLISERRKLKTAIAVSNSTTKVEICGDSMLVIEAIEQKSSIAYKRALLNKLQSDYRNASSVKERHNNEVERKLEQIIATLYSKEKADDAEAKTTTESYRKANLVDLEVTPNFDIEKKFVDLSDYITTFEAEVDLALSDSNAVTKISI